MNSRFLAAAAVAGLVGAGAPAAATIFDINDQATGFVAELSGASEFGSPQPGGVECGLCDSVVNFAAYANPLNQNWVEALGIGNNEIFDDVAQNSPGMDEPLDRFASWVFFYQILNTNPLGGTNADLENFNVTKVAHLPGEQYGQPINVQPYNSAASIDEWDIVDFITDPGLDVGNDFSPSQTGARSIQQSSDGNTGEEAQAISSTRLGGPAPISNAGILQGAFTGALFLFDEGGQPGAIQPDEYSDLLVLASNERYAGFVWAETESSGGFGAAGDVAGIVNPIPLPMPALMLLSGLGGFLVLGRRKTA